MDLEELKQKKKEIEEFYQQELEKSKIENNPMIYDGELEDIKKEIEKLDDLISIYSNPKSYNNPNYKLMKLEQIYIRTMSDKTKEEYKELPEDKRFDIFHNNIPNGWTYDEANYPINKRIEEIEIAIMQNTSLLDIEGIQYKRTV